MCFTDIFCEKNNNVYIFCVLYTRMSVLLQKCYEVIHVGYSWNYNKP